MNHFLKYYKEIESQNHLWRIEIHQESDSAFSPMEIGPVLQGLKLIVQGDQADIDTPIVKTSVEMVFVDAPDLEQDRKCGFWEEFYTSSSTEYKVLLYKDGVCEWTGYITPDSFTETLQYRGSVTIIARDNLGTLQDKTFKMSSMNGDGKVYIYSLINRAITLSNCSLNYVTANLNQPIAVAVQDLRYSDSNALLAQAVDVKQLQNYTWWSALESVLYSAGLVLRYIGRNTLQLMSLRDIPKLGKQYWWDVEERDVTFVAYGTRELVPGVRSIKEENHFDVNTESDPVKVPQYSPDIPTLVQCDNITFIGPNTQSNSYVAPMHGYEVPGKNMILAPSNSNVIDVSAYSKYSGEDSESYGQWDDKSIVYFAVNASDPKPFAIEKKIFTSSGKVSIKWAVDKPISLLSDLSAVMNTPIQSASEYGTDPYLSYRIRLESSDRILYYNATNKQWGTSRVNNTMPLSTGLFTTDKPKLLTFELNEISVPYNGKLVLEFVDIRILVLLLRLRLDCVGMYMRIRDISIDVEIPENIKLLEKLTLTTEYLDKYSVRIERNPIFAILPSSEPEVALVPNAILTECTSQYIGAEQWDWANSVKAATTGISLSRLIHQQLLAFYAKPNNMLTGELATNDPVFSALYNWEGRQHILTSGALNVLTGRMENANLREFTRYEHMWETWVNVDSVEVGPAETTATLLVTSKKALKATDLTTPSWMSFSIGNIGTNYYSVLLKIAQNSTGKDRESIVRVDTALVKVIQHGS